MEQVSVNNTERSLNQFIISLLCCLTIPQMWVETSITLLN